MCAEKSLRRKLHLGLFFRSDTNEGRTFGMRFLTIFDFGEENRISSNGDKVNFVGFCLEIMGDDLMILRFKVVSDG